MKKLETATFVSLRPGRTTTFHTYYDDEGNKHSLVLGLDSNGQEIPYRFKIGKDKRFLKVPLNKKDMNGNSYVEFLRNNPHNEGSPIAGNDIWYKELDTDKDAEIVIEDHALRNKAEGIALELASKKMKGDLDEICASLRIKGSDKVKVRKLLEYANAYPSDFIEMAGDPNRKFKALIETALEAKVIKKRGFRYVFNDEHLGNKESDAIDALSKDKDLVKAIEDALKSSGS